MSEGQISLTKREREVLALLAKGQRNSEIAEILGVTENTVETHLKNIFRKLGISNRVQAVTSYNHADKSDSEK